MHKTNEFNIFICSIYRLRINCIGIFDIVNFDSTQGNLVNLVPHYQVKLISFYYVKFFHSFQSVQVFMYI